MEEAQEFPPLEITITVKASLAAPSLVDALMQIALHPTFKDMHPKQKVFCAQHLLSEMSLLEDQHRADLQGVPF